MKKFIIAALAASIIATPAMAAPGYNQGHGSQNRVEQRYDNRAPQHQVDHRKQYQRPVAVRYAPYQQRQIAHHNWRKGDRFDSRYASNYRVISQPRAYGLRSAPNGYRWVQSGNDAVLIGITSGIVASIMSSIIR
jgi:Ni/Co efflux regulator RcnB